MDDGHDRRSGAVAGRAVSWIIKAEFVCVCVLCADNWWLHRALKPTSMDGRFSKKTGTAFVIQCNQKSQKFCRDMLCIQVAAMERDSSTKGFQAEDERRKMAKKCGPLTHSSSVAQRPFEFFLPAKKRGEKLMNSIKCHFRWRGEIGIVEEREREGRSVFGSPR